MSADTSGGGWEATRWLKYAYEDLQAAQALRSDVEAAPRQACWLAQQAAEKALKAALCFLGIEFGKTHDLDALRNLLPDDCSTRRRYPDLADLTIWAVQGRYPGDWPEATAADADAALEKARGVLEAVSADLQNRGFVWGSDDEAEGA